jgi:hypothetical protein
MFVRLSRALLGFGKGLFRLEPIQHYWWEHLVFRAALAFLMLTAMPFIWSLNDARHPSLYSLPLPSGIGAVFPGITALSDPGVFKIVRYTVFLAAALYVCGVGIPLALTYIFIVDMCLGSLEASQGAHGHSRQTMGLAYLGLAMGAWVVCFLKHRGGWKSLFWASSAAQDFIMNWGRQLVAAAYAVSAVTKEKKSEGLWFLQSESFILAVMKAQKEAVIKGVPISEEAQEFASWMALHPLLSTLMLLSAWLLEISAPLMLLNRRMALVLGLLFWVFHYVNGWFMGLGFPLNRWIITVMFINLPFWVYASYRKLQRGAMLPV